MRDKAEDSKVKAMSSILTHIRMIKKRRFLLSVFAYYQFSKELETEALWNSMLVREINALYTSQTCVRCGSQSKLNRLTQRRFECRNCGWKMNADHNAALNIALRYAEKVMRVKVMNLQKQKQGKGNSTMTDMSAVTPLPSINAGSSSKGTVATVSNGGVAYPMSRMHCTHAVSNDRRSLHEGANGGTACVTSSTLVGSKQCMSDEFMYDRKGNGG